MQGILCSINALALNNIAYYELTLDLFLWLIRPFLRLRYGKGLFRVKRNRVRIRLWYYRTNARQGRQPPIVTALEEGL